MTNDTGLAGHNITGHLVYAWKVIKRAVPSFLEDNCFRDSAALSFYALFSIAPMVFLAVQFAGLLASDIDFQQQVSQQFSTLVGDKAAEGVDVLMNTLQEEDQSRFQLIAGIAVLTFAATNIFVQIQNTFNAVYKVRTTQGAGLLKQALDRLISLGMILSLGFLLIVSLVLDSIVVLFHTYLFSLLNDAAVVVVELSQNLLLIFLVSAVIYALFHFLPDVYLDRKYKIRGSILVAGMLLLGKYGIGLYIANSSLNELGGASASVIILMLWIYYTSLILFFGAEITKAMVELDNVALTPRRYAKRVRTVIVDEPASQTNN